MDSGKQKNMNKNKIIEMREKMEQIEESINSLNYIKWRLKNIQPYESLKVLLKTRESIKESLQLKRQELEELQKKLIIS